MLAKLILGAPMVYLSFRLGLWMLRGLANPLPGPPPAGEMRRVNLRFRCSICGLEIRMTAAPNQEPEPPRHCLEDMDLVAPVE